MPLTTTYGITWLLALVAAIATFLWGPYLYGSDAVRAVGAPRPW